MELSVSQRENIYFAMMGPACLSCLTCCIIIFMILLCKNFHNVPFLLIGILSTFDVINAGAFLIPNYAADNDSSTCQFQAVLLNFTTIGGILWTTFIAFYLYFSVVKENLWQWKTCIKWLGCVLFLCTVDSIIPYLNLDKGYDKTMGWCWINTEEVALRMCLFIVPLWILVPLNCFIFLRIRRYFNICLGDEETERLKYKLKKKLFLYPLLIIFCYGPYTVKTILHTFFGMNKEEYWFTMATGILRCLHGFLNFLVYGCNNKVKGTIKSCVKRSESQQMLMTD